MLVLFFVALWLILRGDLFYVLSCVILFLCFSVLLAMRLSRLGKRELILVLFVSCSICACLVLSVSSSSCCLGRAAVALPVHFSYLFNTRVDITAACVYKMSQHMRKGYLSHRRPAKAQARRRISAVSPDPLLFTDM